MRGREGEREREAHTHTQTVRQTERCCLGREGIEKDEECYHCFIDSIRGLKANNQRDAAAVANRTASRARYCLTTFSQGRILPTTS